MSEVKEVQKCRNATAIGYLRKGDFFTFDGRKYRVGKLLENTNGYVSCIDIENGKSKRFHIDMDVEIAKQEINNGLE